LYVCVALRDEVALRRAVGREKLIADCNAMLSVQEQEISDLEDPKELRWSP